MKKIDTKELIEFIISAGKRLVEKSGHIDEIGIKKQYLTEEDLRIEREIKKIVGRMPGKHKFYAEEENDNFTGGESVWIVDPISGTKFFMEGKPNYAIVVSHMTNGEVDFAVVYNPAVDRLYLANNLGVTVNGKELKPSKSNGKKIIYATYYDWHDEKLEKKLKEKYEVFPSQGSYAINLCLVAEGIFDGVVILANDAFPSFAGCFIANKLGLTATNILGNKDILTTDRVFICGNNENYDNLLQTTRASLDLNGMKK